MSASPHLSSASEILSVQATSAPTEFKYVVGDAVGDEVGAPEGDPVGAPVGEPVAAILGDAVDDPDCDPVGAAVGTSVASPSALSMQTPPEHVRPSQQSCSRAQPTADSARQQLRYGRWQGANRKKKMRQPRGGGEAML